MLPPVSVGAVLGLMIGEMGWREVSFEGSLMVGMGGSLLDGESGVCYRPRIVVTLRGATASFLWTKGEEKKPGVLSSSD